MLKISKARWQIILVTTVAIMPTLYAPYPVNFLAPLIVFLYYRLPYDLSLWASCGAGLLMDILATDGHFGIYALSYTITTALLYHRKKHFFEESLVSLPALTASFSALSTLFLGAGKWSLLWILTDVLILPLIDGAWAFVAFTIPLWLIFRGPRIQRPYRMPRPK